MRFVNSRVIFSKYVFGVALAVAALWVAADQTSQTLFRIKKEALNEIEMEFGEEAKQRALAWQALVQADAANSDLSENEKLRRANDFFNTVTWLTDTLHWGVDDYWATPLETLASNGGDCEDFSIGKYFSLENVHVPVEKIRITYVKALEYNQAHMVLAYYPTPHSEPLILDNINQTILPASQRPDLYPVYSFDAQNIWLAKNRGKKLKAASKESLPKWKRVNERLGFELVPDEGS